MFFRSFLFIVFLFKFTLFASVEINIPNTVVKGEPLIFSITIFGNDIKFPNLSLIDGNVVQEISSSSSTNIINGKFTRQIKKLYSLYPSQNVNFPSFEFEVNSQKIYSKQKKVLISNPTKTISDTFDLEIKNSKNEVYVGENFILTLVFKYKKYSQIVDLSFEQPNFENFWFKQLNETKKYDDGDYIVQELNFLLSPLKEGILEISPIKIQVQLIDPSRDSFLMYTNGVLNKSIYSNSLKITSKKLPLGIDLIGDFDIKSTIDKSSIKKGEAVSYKLVINGIGNIDDIKDIKLNLDEATIYENKPEIKTSFKNGNYVGIYEKVFSIVPSKNIVIPAIELKYFNKEKNKIIVKKTESFNLIVDEFEVSNVSNKLEKALNNDENKQVIKVIEKSSLKDNILYFCLGIIVTLLILCLYWYVINSKKQKALNEMPLVKKVKSCKTKNELFKVLVKFINKNERLDELIFKLEKSEDIINIKKDIISLLKHIDIKR